MQQSAGTERYYAALSSRVRNRRTGACPRGAMMHYRDLVFIRKLCGLGLPAQTLAPSLLPALRKLIPSHSAAVFWVDDRFEMTGLYAERLLPPEAMARYYESHYQQSFTGCNLP